MRENGVLRVAIDSYVKIVSSIEQEQYAAAYRTNTEPFSINHEWELRNRLTKDESNEKRP